MTPAKLNDMIHSNAGPQLPTTACPECDLLVRIQPMNPGDRTACPRCGHWLARHETRTVEGVLALTLAAVILAAAALGFDFLSFTSRGQAHTMTLFQCAAWFFIEDRLILGSVVTLTLFLIPAGYLLGIGYIVLALNQKIRPMGGTTVFRWVHAAGPWVMTDVFMVAVLVSLVKIAGMADVRLGLSFWAYGLFCLILCALTARVDPHRFWDALEEAGI